VLSQNKTTGIMKTERKLFIDQYCMYTLLYCIQPKFFYIVRVTYKFRRFMIGQNCNAMCINEGGQRDTFSNIINAEQATERRESS
jgi:hypothetical protein